MTSFPFGLPLLLPASSSFITPSFLPFLLPAFLYLTAPFHSLASSISLPLSTPLLPPPFSMHSYSSSPSHDIALSFSARSSQPPAASRLFTLAPHSPLLLRPFLPSSCPLPSLLTHVVQKSVSSLSLAVEGFGEVRVCKALKSTKPLNRCSNLQ